MTTQVQNNATEINTNASTEVENSTPAAVITPVKAKKQVKREDLTQEIDALINALSVEKIHQLRDIIKNMD